jgi:hypothetical protein
VKLSNRPRLWLPPKSAFAGYRFPPEVIVVAVRWYLRYNLSYRDVEELLVECCATLGVSGWASLLVSLWRCREAPPGWPGGAPVFVLSAPCSR